MTPRIPLSLCRKCPHYRGYCPLQDLEPCPYAPSRNKCLIALLALVVGAIITAIIGVLLASATHCTNSPQSNPTEFDGIIIDAVSAVELLRNQRRNELSDFDKLIMAIAYTESRFNPDADSGQGDRGLLQITEPYVREVNRISGANFKREDAFCIDSSLAMFAVIQDYYNPAHGIDEAIYRHNKSESYRRTVLENLEMINRYEALRAKLIMTHY